MYSNAKGMLIFVLMLTAICHGAPIFISTETSNAKIPAYQMMTECCFAKGSVSLCDIALDNNVYCLADGLPPAQRNRCVYRKELVGYRPMSLVRCTGNAVVKSVAIPQNPVPMPENPSFDNCECHDIANVKLSDRQDMLMQQLLGIHKVFDKLGIMHLLAYGTAIGALRSNDINDLENDNDRVGLIIFQHDIFRVCKLSLHSTKEGGIPFADNPLKMFSKVCPYTDLYPTNVDTSPFALDSIRIRDTLFNILPRAVTSKILEYRYGKNWIVHPMHNAEGQASNSGDVKDNTEDTKRKTFEIIHSNG